MPNGAGFKQAPRRDEAAPVERNRRTTEGRLEAQRSAGNASAGESRSIEGVDAAAGLSLNAVGDPAPRTVRC